MDCSIWSIFEDVINILSLGKCTLYTMVPINLVCVCVMCMSAKVVNVNVRRSAFIHKVASGVGRTKLRCVSRMFTIYYMLFVFCFLFSVFTHHSDNNATVGICALCTYWFYLCVYVYRQLNVSRNWNCLSHFLHGKKRYYKGTKS